MRFPSYPEYRDSGADWLGEIPDGWIIKPLWALFRRHKLTGFPNEQLLSVYRDYGVIPKASRDDNFNKTSDDLNAYQLVQVDDLAINKMKAWQGSVGISKYKGIVSPAYHVYTPIHSEIPSYLHHLFRCKEYVAGYLANSKGIRVNQWDLEPQQHSRMSVLLPTLQEQTQIAKFLGHETARIDALIEEQQRLIELLKEKRQAVISLAVTKGLDPSVPMKNSGVEWLGKVPAHWSVAGLKWFWSVTDCKHITADFVDDGIPLASIREVQSRYVSLEYARQTTKEFYLQLIEAGREPAAGDLIFSRNATVGEVAQVANWHPPFALGQDVCLLKRKYKWLSSDYLQVALLSTVVKVQLDNLMIGSTFKRVNVEDIRGLTIPMPSHEEQKLIADYLSKETEFFDALLSEAKSTIGLLHERRSALISAAVTGKIDVRGWKPPASAKVQELEEETM